MARTAVMEHDLPAFRRIRTTLVVIHVALIISGLADVVLGVFLASDIKNVKTKASVHAETSLISVIWLLGLPFIITGSFGIYTAHKGSKIWVLVWTLLTLTTNCGVYVYIAISGQLNPDIFGANLNVYRRCHNQSNRVCLCILPARNSFGVLYTLCEDARLKTTLFLVLVTLYSLALATIVIAIFLQIIMILCLPKCLSKREENLRVFSSPTSFYAAETTCLPGSTDPLPSTSYRSPLLCSPQETTLVTDTSIA